MRGLLTGIMLLLPVTAWAQTTPSDPVKDLAFCSEYATDVKVKRDNLELENARLRAEVKRLNSMPTTHPQEAPKP